MKISNSLTDAAVLTELGTRLSARRLAMQFTQAEVAKQAGIAKRTLERVEAGHSAEVATLVRVLRALDSLEDFNALLPESGPTPMELLQNNGRKRQRAPRQESSSEGNHEDAKAKPSAWKWDEST